MEAITEKKNDLDIGISANYDADKWLEIFSLFVHDLESPLASMKYILKLINDGKYDNEKQMHRQLASSAQIAMHRAETIIYDILAVARSGKMGLPVNITKLKPGPVIENVINLAQGAAAENGIEIRVRDIHNEEMVLADPDLLQRTLDNFIYNALRHTPSNGEVIVFTSMGKKSITIHVKDSGSGLGDIEPNVLFEKFGQVDLRAKGKHRGVGLGLYFCKLAATGMGGTVLADDHPDGGAVFSIKLQKAGGE